MSQKSRIIFAFTLLTSCISSSLMIAQSVQVGGIVSGDNTTIDVFERTSTTSTRPFQPDTIKAVRIVTSAAIAEDLLIEKVGFFDGDLESLKRLASDQPEISQASYALFLFVEIDKTKAGVGSGRLEFPDQVGVKKDSERWVYFTVPHIPNVIRTRAILFHLGKIVLQSN